MTAPVLSSSSSVKWGWFSGLWSGFYITMAYFSTSMSLSVLSTK